MNQNINVDPEADDDDDEDLAGAEQNPPTEFFKTMRMEVDIVRDALFHDIRHGYYYIFENIALEQQSKGTHRRPHNALLDSDVEKMLQHPQCNLNTAKGYVTRLILVIGLLLGVRPTALRLLSWRNFTECLDEQGKKSYRYVGTVGSEDGDTKTQRGDIPAIRLVPTNFYIYDEELAYGLNPYEILKKHEELCAITGNRNQDFFLSPNMSRNSGHFLKKTPIGRNSFAGYFNSIVKACGVKGVGFRDKPALHCLRTTLITK
eukprot:IDg205t1